jgi:hypothetical protein
LKWRNRFADANTIYGYVFVLLRVRSRFLLRQLYARVWRSPRSLAALLFRFALKARIWGA